MNADSSRPKLRILVITNETARGEELYEAVLAQAAGAETTDVLVVAPALNSRLKHWLSDEDGARREAAQRVDDCVARFEQAGLTATGTIGDPDPLHAIEDALGDFDADRIVISTHPEGRSNWLAHDLVGRAERQFHFRSRMLSSTSSARRRSRRGGRPPSDRRHVDC